MSKEIVLTEKEIKQIVIILNSSGGIPNTTSRIKVYAKEIAKNKNKRSGRTDISQRTIINLILANPQIMAHGIFQRFPDMARNLKTGKGRPDRTRAQYGDEYKRRFGGQLKKTRKKRRGRR